VCKRGVGRVEGFSGEGGWRGLVERVGRLLMPVDTAE